MTDYVVKSLDPHTWDAFARLVERHNGVFGGCWCTWFHTFHAEKTFSAEDNRALKKRLVEEGRAHAALVFDGDEAVAWCQYGTPEELPNIHHRKEYETALDKPPDYRITCIFVDKKHRREGITSLADERAPDHLGSTNRPLTRRRHVRSYGDVAPSEGGTKVPSPSCRTQIRSGVQSAERRSRSPR